jgi:hypothetical protein
LPKCSLTHQKAEQRDIRHAVLSKAINLSYALLPGRSDYMDIPLHSLAFHVYPDLYYNIGLLKANKTMQSFEKVNQYKDVFNLWHYYIGLHQIRKGVYQSWKKPKF